MNAPSIDSRVGNEAEDSVDQRKRSNGAPAEVSSDSNSLVTTYVNAPSAPWFGRSFQLLPSCSMVVLWKHGTAIQSPWIGDVSPNVLKTMTNRVGIRFSGILPFAISCRLLLLDDGSRSGFNQMVPRSRKAVAAPFELRFPPSDFSATSEVFPFEPFMIPKPTVGIGLNLRFVVVVQDSITGQLLAIVSSSCFQVRGRQPCTPEENERRRQRIATCRCEEEESSLQQ
eukprot:ANDGO_07230.mRNA.1 hypothetical protein